MTQTTLPLNPLCHISPPSSGVRFSSLALHRHSRPVTAAGVDTVTSYIYS